MDPETDPERISETKQEMVIELPVFPGTPVQRKNTLLTRKQADLATKLLFDCPVLLSMSDHTQVERVRTHHLGLGAMNRVERWVREMFHAAFGRNIAMSEVSEDKTMFGIYMTDEDLECIYQYSMQFRHLRMRGGVTSSWMSPWTVFQLAKDERTICVLTPNQLGFLDICHVFPTLASGPCQDPSCSEKSARIPNMICSMGPVLAARSFEIMNSSYEDGESGISWGNSVQR